MGDGKGKPLWRRWVGVNQLSTARQCRWRLYIGHVEAPLLARSAARVPRLLDSAPSSRTSDSPESSARCARPRHPDTPPRRPQSRHNPVVGRERFPSRVPTSAVSGPYCVANRIPEACVLKPAGVATGRAECDPQMPRPAECVPNTQSLGRIREIHKPLAALGT
jgi:hypothetical protein